MPTYLYRCADCAEQLEAVQRMTDAPLAICPTCGGGLRKVIQPVGVVFKGSGFYRTDSRDSKSNGNGSVKGSANGKGEPANGTAKKDSGKDTAASSSSGSPDSGGSSSPNGSSGSAKTSTAKAAAG